MFKDYIFKVDIYDRDGNIREQATESWKDKGETIARINLRYSLQSAYKQKHGYWPRVELYCQNRDIQCYKEDEGEY